MIIKDKIKPYYETKNGKLYCGDCQEIMPLFIDKQFDLVLTDPPYGIRADKKAHACNGKMGLLAKKTEFNKTNWDCEIPKAKIFKQILQQAKHHIIFGGNYFVQYLSNSPCWLVWDKEINGNFADCELAWTNFQTAIRKFKYRWNGMLQENAGKHKEKRYHPTQKPVGLFVQILDKYSEKRQTILDPFSGVGTTALACERLGERKWVLIEKEEQYCEIAAKRLEAETRQLKLF